MNKQDAELVGRITDYLSGGGLVNPELAKHDAVRDLLIEFREALQSSHGSRIDGPQTFTMFRRNVPTETHNENQRNAPDEPQFEGCVFSDGRIAVRWLTAKRSVSVWDCMDDLLAIHGHPEYQSELVWHQARAAEGSQ